MAVTLAGTVKVEVPGVVKLVVVDFAGEGKREKNDNSRAKEDSPVFTERMGNKRFAEPISSVLLLNFHLVGRIGHGGRPLCSKDFLVIADHRHRGVGAGGRGCRGLGARPAGGLGVCT